MLTLAIDTSTSLLSLALVCGDKVLASYDEATKNNQSEILLSRIERMMADCQLKPSDLEQIAVAVGPGSYTGIRVGVAAAKSLGYALDIPVVAVSSLEVMANFSLEQYCVSKQKPRTDLVVPMIDARRGTVFAGAYDSNGERIVSDGHYNMNDFLEKLPKEKSIFYVADESLVFKEEQYWITLETALDEGSKAETLARLAAKKMPVENIHELVPSYLRKTEAEMNAGV